MKYKSVAERKSLLRRFLDLQEPAEREISLDILEDLSIGIPAVKAVIREYRGKSKSQVN